MYSLDGRTNIAERYMEYVKLNCISFWGHVEATINYNLL